MIQNNIKITKQIFKKRYINQKIINSFAFDYKQLSYVHGTSNIPLKYQTIGQLIYQQANKYSDKTAIISYHQNKQLTYQQLLEKAETLAASFLKLGLKKHDRIGVYSPNNIEWTIIQIASALSNLILVNINPAYQKSELEYCLNKVNVKCLITSNKLKTSNYIQMIQEIIPELQNNLQIGQINSKRCPDLEILIRLDDEKAPGFLNFNDLFEMELTKETQKIKDMNIKEIQPQDPNNIQFTSGTTGNPKGAILSHFNLINNSYFIGDRMQITQKDNICVPMPLYHCMGMVLGNMVSLNYGATAIYPGETFSAKSVLESITKHNCTAVYGVPTMYLEYFKEYEKNPEQYDVSNLRTGIMSGSLCPPLLMEKAINLFNMKDITICYGMTETSPVSFQTSYNDSFENKTQTVGKIQPYVEAKVVDQNGHVVKRNEQGELWVKGYHVMLGYYNDEIKTKETITQDNWLKTGDLVELNDQGYLMVTGRLKDMIIRGGENLYPKEIENFILGLDEIQDVQIVGVPDEKYGEELMAQIIVKDKFKKENKQNLIKKLKNNCKGQISHFKIPRYWQIVDEFPMTPTGKVVKYKIVEDIKNNINNLNKFDYQSK